MSSNALEKYNSDDILIRSIIAGVLNLLNNNIKYNQVWDANISEEIVLPWLFDMGNSSSERFIQDNYTFFGRYNPCLGGAQKIDGNFDVYPRGILRYQSTQIDSDNICNRFVQGIYTKMENGIISTYRSFLYSIPITVNFECVVLVDNFTNLLKIEQSIREALFRNKTFYVMFKGMKIGCCLGMPDNYNGEKTTDFSISTETGEPHQKLTFSIVVESYHPVYDKSLEMENSNFMKAVGWDVTYSDNNKRFIKLNAPDTMITNCISKLSWTYNSDNSDMCSVNLYYKEHNSDEWQPIELGLTNQSDYYWTVPNSLYHKQDIDIFYKLDDDITMINEPDIRIISYDGKLINESFVIINPGRFITDDSEVEKSIKFDISYEKNGNTEFIENAGEFVIFRGKILRTQNVQINEIFDTVKSKTIDLMITDYKDKNIKNVVSDIKIF